MAHLPEVLLCKHQPPYILDVVGFARDVHSNPTGFCRVPLLENHCSVRRIKEIGLLFLLVGSPDTHTHTPLVGTFGRFWESNGILWQKVHRPFGAHSHGLREGLGRLTRPGDWQCVESGNLLAQPQAAMELGLVEVAGMWGNLGIPQRSSFGGVNYSQQAGDMTRFLYLKGHPVVLEEGKAGRGQGGQKVSAAARWAKRRVRRTKPCCWPAGGCMQREDPVAAFPRVWSPGACPFLSYWRAGFAWSFWHLSRLLICPQL